MELIAQARIVSSAVLIVPGFGSQRGLGSTSAARSTPPSDASLPQVLLHWLARNRRRIAILLFAIFPLLMKPARAFGYNTQSGGEAAQYLERGLELAREGNLTSAEAQLRRAAELAPSSPEILGQLGIVLAQQEKLAQACEFFERALRMDPSNWDLRRNLAAAQWQQGSLISARENLRLILRDRPHDEPTVLLMGLVAENLADYETAVKMLSSIPAQVRQRPESLVALARSQYQTGDARRAQVTLAELLDHPAGVQGIFLGGQIASESGDYETAEKLFMSINDNYPDRTQLGYELALAQFRAKYLEKCKKTLMDLIDGGSQSSDIYSLLGWCHYEQKNFQESVRAFDRAIDLDPTKESNYLDLGKMLIETRAFAAAMTVANKGAEKIPTSYRIHMLKGTAQIKQLNYREAIRSYARACELNPSSPGANHNLARAQFLAGRMNEALAILEEGIKRFPRDLPHYIEYASILLRLNETGEVSSEARITSLLETAISIESTLSEPHYLLGNLFLNTGRIEEAIKYLARAAELDPQSTRAHFALSRAYRRAGRNEEASRELQSFQALRAEEERLASTAALPQSGRN